VGAASPPAAVASGIGDAFMVAAVLAAAAALVALIVLPSARTFLPKLRLAPGVSIHKRPRCRLPAPAAAPTPSAATPASSTRQWRHSPTTPKRAWPRS